MQPIKDENGVIPSVITASKVFFALMTMLCLGYTLVGEQLRHWSDDFGTGPHGGWTYKAIVVLISMLCAAYVVVVLGMLLRYREPMEPELEDVLEQANLSNVIRMRSRPTSATEEIKRAA